MNIALIEVIEDLTTDQLIISVEMEWWIKGQHQHATGTFHGTHVDFHWNWYSEHGSVRVTGQLAIWLTTAAYQYQKRKRHARAYGGSPPTIKNGWFL